ncbi:hypothetical protein BO221_11315 [Archangium sp. Cb G35]|nr:hypothetical protein BO221_11315 [Archangium sp. Cb G35]
MRMLGAGALGVLLGCGGPALPEEVTDAAGQVESAATALISETFDTSAANFTTVGGTWSVTGGQLVLANAAASERETLGLANTALHKTSVTGDFQLEVDARTTDSHLWADFAVVFGRQSSTRYLYASFNVSNDANTHGLFRVVDGVQTQLADFSGQIAANTSYRIRVIRNGNAVAVYLNGVKLASATESQLTSGQVGVGSRDNNGRFDNFAVITGRPDATNTGVPSGAALTVHNGDLTITTNGTVIEGLDIHGFVTVRASNVVIRRSIIRGGVATRNRKVVSFESGTDNLIEDSELTVANPSAWIDNLGGSNFTARRLNIHGGVDGIKAGSNTVIERCYIHDMTYFSVDPNQGGKNSHNDAIQILSGSNIQVQDNNLVMPESQNAAIQVTQDFGVVSSLFIRRNWADGGRCTFNFSHKGGTSLTVSATNNRFGRNSYYNCPILKSTGTTGTFTGNVWDDTGATVGIQTHD